MVNKDVTLNMDEIGLILEFLSDNERFKDTEIAYSILEKFNDSPINSLTVLEVKLLHNIVDAIGPTRAKKYNVSLSDLLSRL